MKNRICSNCFTELGEDDVCSNCGYRNTEDNSHPLALPCGTVLGGKYIVGRVLGQGGFGITYIAQDYETKQRVAVKEYFPEALATRRSESTEVLSYASEKSEGFQYGKKCFLEEAKTLSEFIGNPNIVRVYSYFEENNTAYFAMEYVEGISLMEYIAQKGGKISFYEARTILLPVMSALSEVHAKGIIHRDISPDNIFIRNDGTVKLIDFGAARYSLGDKSKSLDVILKHGYAPKEQYTRRGKQGPFTDVYALAATFYKAITGKVPPDAVERMDEDDIINPSSLGVKIPDEAEEALMKALSVQASERYQSMADFKKALEEIPADIPAEVISEPVKEESSEPVSEKPPEPVSVGETAKTDESPEQVPAALPAGRKNWKKVTAWGISAATMVVILIAAIVAANNRQTDVVYTDTSADVTEVTSQEEFDSSVEEWSELWEISNITESSAISYTEDSKISSVVQVSEKNNSNIEESQTSKTESNKAQQSSKPQQSSVSQQSSRPQQSSVVQQSSRPQQSSVVQQSSRPQQSSVVQPSSKPQQSSVVQPSSKPQQSSVVQQSSRPQQSSVVQQSSRPQQSSVVQQSSRPQQSSVAQPSSKPQQSSVVQPSSVLQPNYTFENGTLTIYSNKYFDDDYKKFIGTRDEPLNGIIKVIIKDGVTEISGKAFEYFYDLTSVSIPNSVVKIGDSAFGGCKSLISITIPDGVMTIGDSVFDECKSLTSITIPSSVTEIEYYAFYGCTGLTSITIPRSVTKIQDYAFYGCTSLKSVTLSSGLKKIGVGAFSTCTSLESIEIPNSVTFIDEQALAGCTSLESITIPDSVKYMNAWIFEDWMDNQTIYVKGRSERPSTWNVCWNDYCDAKIVWNA